MEEGWGQANTPVNGGRDFEGSQHGQKKDGKQMDRG